jgi:hypothetical protein
MNLEIVEKRLQGMDNEIHMLLHYIYKQKKGDAQVEINEYENLKKTISKHLKEPIDPIAEIRIMREKNYQI